MLRRWQSAPVLGFGTKRPLALPNPAVDCIQGGICGAAGRRQRPASALGGPARRAPAQPQLATDQPDSAARQPALHCAVYLGDPRPRVLPWLGWAQAERMPGRVGKHGPPLAAGLELRLASAQI